MLKQWNWSGSITIEQVEKLELCFAMPISDGRGGLTYRIPGWLEELRVKVETRDKNEKAKAVKAYGFYGIGLKTLKSNVCYLPRF